MPKSRSQPDPKVKTVAQCVCGATKFHGPAEIGEFVNGAFVVQQQVWRCVNCHREYDQAGIDELQERKIDLPG